jgi:2,3-dihydroxybenzoate-AMP ligase
MLEGCVAWPAEFAQRYRNEGYWGDATLFDVLARAAKAYPDKTALVDGNCRRSYSQLLRNVEALAAGLYAAGLRPLDRVVFQLANGAPLVEAFFALARIGAIPVLALPAHRKSEIAHFARASGAVALMVPDVVRGFDYRDMAREVAAECPDLRHVLVDGEPASGQIDLRALSNATGGASCPCRQPPAEEVALMLLSGGTTGLPKLIPRTHTDYLCGSLHAARVAGFKAGTVFLAVLPMAHNYTLGAPGVLGALACGGTLVIAPATAAEVVIPLIATERVTVISAAVPLAAKWLASGLLEDADLGSLEVFMCGGAKLAPELRRRVEQKFRCLYQESYGTAEGLLNMTRLDDPEAVRMQSSGRPVSPADEIRIVDPHGREVPDGQTGELQVRGPYTIRGYYRAPEINAKAFTDDGFYRMGDVARKVGDYLYLEGRIKDLINRGGEKISCEEIENHILAHPGIESACVVAMPDAVFGEKACAVVILLPECRLALDELLEFLKGQNIARFKMPERLEVVNEFPISPAGKILRRELQAALAAKLAGSG